MDLWPSAVNVAVLVWLLRRFFWRPVAAIIARRSDEVRTTLANAAGPAPPSNLSAQMLLQELGAD